MKKLLSLLFTVVMLCSVLAMFAVPATASKYDGTVKGDILSSGTCEKFKGQLGGLYKYNSLEIVSGDTVTIKENVQVTVNDRMSNTKCMMEKDSTLIIYGILLISAPSPNFKGKIIIKDGGSLKLDVYNIDFVDINSNLVIEVNGKLAITASPNCMSNIENLFRDMSHTIKNNTLIVSNSYVGSVISEGSLTIVVGVGFAVPENAFILVGAASTVSVANALIRGFGAGMMHGVCTLAVGYGMTFVHTIRKLFYTGTIALLAVAMIYYSVYNTLVQSSHQLVGFLLSVITFIPVLVLLNKTEKAQ